jgi:hypothetical protein
MCPVCWINGLVAFLISMGLLAIDSPYTPVLIGIAAILTMYSIWKLWEGYKKWKNFTKEQRSQNWKAIRRFVYGLVVGSVITSAVWYSMEQHQHDAMDEKPHGGEHKNDQ